MTDSSVNNVKARGKGQTSAQFRRWVARNRAHRRKYQRELMRKRRREKVDQERAAKGLPLMKWGEGTEGRKRGRRRRRAGRKGESVSGNRKVTNHKQLTNDSTAFRPETLFTLSRATPHPATFLGWVRDLRQRLGVFGLRALGVPAPVVLSGKVPSSPAQRVVFLIWSYFCCPSNYGNALHLATWGRFNPKMPKDYTLAAERLLARKTGPARARAAGKPYKPFSKPWARKAPCRGEYLALPNLPLL